MSKESFGKRTAHTKRICDLKKAKEMIYEKLLVPLEEPASSSITFYYPLLQVLPKSIRAV